MRVPVGWSVTIDNDPAWQVHLVAKALVGAAFLDPATFGPVTLQPESGFTCEAIAQAKPYILLTLYEPDRLRRRKVAASVTDK